MLGNQIQNYKIISLLGEGGMGDVYLAEHVSIKRKVAIKILKPELFKNEEITNTRVVIPVYLFGNPE